MAKAEIKCTCPECGATHYWSVTCHNRREADNWEQYHADDTDRLCPACYAKQQAAKRAEAREAENKAAAETAGALGLPELAGTEKQVAWATTIRQKALDEALAPHGGSLANLNDKGRAVLAAAMTKLPTEARWWIDHRDDAACVAREEMECASWAQLDEARRNEKLARARAEIAEIEGRGGPGVNTRDNLRHAVARSYERYDRARLAGRGSMEQREADKVEAAAKKAAEEAAKLATLPPKPATLAERVGRPGARWNGKFYGRDELRVYLDGAEVQVPAEIKSAWDREWREYNAAKKAAGIA